MFNVCVLFFSFVVLFGNIRIFEHGNDPGIDDPIPENFDINNIGTNMYVCFVCFCFVTMEKKWGKIVYLYIKRCKNQKTSRKKLFLSPLFANCKLSFCSLFPSPPR